MNEFVIEKVCKFVREGHNFCQCCAVCKSCDESTARVSELHARMILLGTKQIFTNTFICLIEISSTCPFCNAGIFSFSSTRLNVIFVLFGSALITLLK